MTAEAQFLTAKYGTAAGPTGLPAAWPTPLTTIGLDAMLAALGILLLGIIIFAVLRDLAPLPESESSAQRKHY